MSAVRLGDHARLVRGITFKPRDKCDPQDEGAVVCMRTKNVQATLDASDLIAVPCSLVKNNEKMLSAGDILVSSANSWSLVGKCCQVPKLEYPSTAGGFISILRPTTEKLESSYLYRWFSSDVVQRKLRSLANQTTNISNLNHKRTLDLRIPLPPLAEQKRIARILDAADALRTKRREALAQLDTLLRSTFLDMFGDPVANPMGWKETRVGDATQIGTGSTPLRKNKNYYDGSIPWVKSTEVDWGKITATSECVSADGVKAARLKLYPKGSIVLALYGQGKTRGKCAVLGIDATINQACCVLTPRDPISTPYLFQFLKDSYHRLRGESRGGNQENLNMGIVRRFPVPVPPLEAQQRYADVAEFVEKQRTSQFAHLAELDTLFSSLQSRAFRGDL